MHSPANMEIDYVACLVNGVFDYFVFDTGCSSGLAINKKFLKKIIDSGQLSKNDYMGDSSMLTAVGNYETVKVFFLKEVILGTPENALRLNNVLTIVYDSDDGPLLLGQDIIKRFSSLTIDNKNKNFILVK